MILHLVCDASGSMAESGKHLVVRGVVRATEQYFRLGYGSSDLKLITWKNEARVVEWTGDKEFPPEMLVCNGAGNMESLIDLLSHQPDGKVLFITDGFWSQNDMKTFKRWKERLPVETLRIIKIGGDANPQLKGMDVFTSEELFAALDGWVEGATA